MSNKKTNLFVNTLVLLLVTFVAVTALAVVNQITAGPIAQAEINQKAEAYKVVYPDATEFAEIDGIDDMLADSSQLLADNGFEGCSINEALAVKSSSGDIEGYIVAATSPYGYGGDIQVAIGIKDGKLTGFTVISNSETAGLGSKCTEPEFTAQFKDKSASILTYTKAGASSDTEIDAISGATITTNAVTGAVNAAIIFYQSNFGGGVQEIAKPDLTEFYQKAYPSATEFADVENAEAVLSESKKVLESYGLTDCTVEEVKVVNGGEGYVISTTGIGFAKSAPIQIAVGIKGDKLTGFAVVSQMETEGYGAVCAEDSFASQFAGKKLGVLKAKVGATADDEIDAISGATFTTNGVTNAVNAAIVFYMDTFGDGAPDVHFETADVEAGATAPAGE